MTKRPKRKTLRQKQAETRTAVMEPRGEEAFESPESSLVKGAVYDHRTGQLTVRFDATVYDFSGIPATLWEGFLMATSKGRYFNERIRPMYAGKVRD